MAANLESKVFRINRTKTEYMRCDFGTTISEYGDISLGGPGSTKGHLPLFGIDATERW